MFKKVTKSIVNQMDPSGNLIPVQSIIDHEHFRPLCLVRQDKKTMFQNHPPYKQTGYSLEDVLLPGEDSKSTESLFPNRGGQDSEQFTFKKSISDKVDANLSFPVDSANIDAKAGASSSREWSVKLEKNSIPVPKLQALTAERKINENHSFIRQLKKKEQTLYVVHETIKASDEVIYEECSKAEGNFMTKFYIKFSAQGSRENKQGIIIPKGCSLAFKAIPLDIRDGSWDLMYFYQDKTLRVSTEFVHGQLGALQEEVKENCQILTKLYSKLRDIFLKAIKAVMRDRNLFQELTHKMEAVLDETDSCELKTESPDLKDLLSTLQHSSRHLLLKLARAITYTLDALDELTEDQLLLLLESLEEKIVSQQLKLVESILQCNVEFGKGPFSVDARLLSFPREEEQKLTIAMVEMSGVKLQEDGSAVCTEDNFSALAALTVSLYVLSLLSN
ncbi:gasdermin-A [Mycteria americana]|uniref:gasdermin-A n=1 Tax=Mycteria americana TaxID=33587 RepID=UPI003F5814C2